MATVIITGTPGSGKSTVAKLISSKLGYRTIDVKRIISQKTLRSGFDKERQCEIIDTKKLNNELIKIIKDSKKNLVIESHLSHHLSPEYVNLCIVTKCDLLELKKRLEKRGYSKSKVRENLDCEIFDICYNEALENGHKIVVIDTTKGVDKNKLFSLLKHLNKRQQ